MSGRADRYQQRDEREDGLGVAEAQVADGQRLAIEVEIVREAPAELATVLRARDCLEVVRADAGEHRAAQNAGHVDVQRLAIALARPELRVLAQTQIVENGRLALQQRAGAVIHIVTRRLHRTAAPNPPRTDTSGTDGRTARSATAPPAR